MKRSRNLIMAAPDCGVDQGTGGFDARITLPRALVQCVASMTHLCMTALGIFRSAKKAADPLSTAHRFR
jgi:hypothetical protein